MAYNLLAVKNNFSEIFKAIKIKSIKTIEEQKRSARLSDLMQPAHALWPEGLRTEHNYNFIVAISSDGTINSAETEGQLQSSMNRA